jgi:hypothetical protein
VLYSKPTRIHIEIVEDSEQQVLYPAVLVSTALYPAILVSTAAACKFYVVFDVQPSAVLCG